MEMRSWKQSQLPQTRNREELKAEAIADGLRATRKLSSRSKSSDICDFGAPIGAPALSPSASHPRCDTRRSSIPRRLSPSPEAAECAGVPWHRYACLAAGPMEKTRSEEH